MLSVVSYIFNAVGNVAAAKQATAGEAEEAEAPAKLRNCRPWRARSDRQGTAQISIISLDRDLQIIQHFLGLGPKIGQSLVRFDENDRIVVIEGPLKGIEGSIVKVDKRKQRAKICVDFGGAAHTMDLGFEDIGKK